MVTQTAPASFTLSPDLLLPDLLRIHPQARPVFDRYGLKGCGGRLGPVESIRFFARTHGVDEDQLMAELQHAINAPIAPPPLVPSVADTIYRRFFTAGILLILTAGATWGAWLLWQIGVKGNFTAISIHHVNAHGHAQIYGWVGLFIMGFACQAFPRIWHTQLFAPRLAVVAFLAMAAGLVIRTLGMTLSGSWSLALPTAMLGGALEILAILLFVAQILLTFRFSQARLEPYVGFAVMALLFFASMSVMCVWHTYMTMTAPTRDTLLWYVATYQAPLRDLQIHGLALFMILGVCLRMLPPLYDLPQIPARRAWTALAILALAVLGEVALFIAYRFTANHAIAALLMLPWLLLAAGVGLIVLPWRLWHPFHTTDRSVKFIRTAYAWLAISLAMLLLLPLYQSLTGIPFSHAYYGAIRHAITVGFISLMIMGFAAKVVPTLNGLDPRALSPLWGPFILVNLGCFLRVSLQTLTDFHPRFFAFVGLSGTLEVAGLAWWGLGLILIMRRGKRELENPDLTPAAPCSAIPAQIEDHHHVADVITWYPNTLDVFDRYGFTLLRQPLFRKTLARGVTLRQATTLRNVNTAEFLQALNQTIQPKPLN